MDGFLEPSKLTTYRRNKMTNGINTDGFSATGEQSGSNTIDAKYSPNTGSAFPAQDKSAQDGAGLNNGGK